MELRHHYLEGKTEEGYVVDPVHSFVFDGQERTMAVSISGIDEVVESHLPGRVIVKLELNNKSDESRIERLEQIAESFGVQTTPNRKPTIPRGKGSIYSLKMELPSGGSYASIPINTSVLPAKIIEDRYGCRPREPENPQRDLYR